MLPPFCIDSDFFFLVPFLARIAFKVRLLAERPVAVVFHLHSFLMTLHNALHLLDHKSEGKSKNLQERRMKLWSLLLVLFFSPPCMFVTLTHTHSLTVIMFCHRRFRLYGV